MYNEEDNSWKLWVIVGAGILFFVLLFSVYSVPAGNVGVITRFGAVNRVVNPGVGFKIPFVEWNRRMSVQTQKVQFETGAASSNMQIVDATVSVNYRLIGSHALDVYQEVGKNYEEVVIINSIEQAFKATTAKYTAEEVITLRNQLSLDVKNALQEALNPYHIVVQAFNITNVDFSEQYDESIEQKQVQEQKVEIAELKRQEAEKNAETILINAQAEADAQEILNNTGALSDSYLRYLFLTNWNGVLPEVISGAQPVFDVSTYVPQD